MTKLQIVTRIHRILNLFDYKNPELGLTDISTNTGINKTTTLGILSSLQSIGMLEKSSSNRKYRLGRYLMQLAAIYLKNIDLKTVALPHIEKLHAETGEEIALHIRDGNFRKLVHVIESDKPVRHIIDSESLISPLYAGAPGKLLLAYLPDEEIKKILNSLPVKRYTKNTMVTEDELLKEIEKIRKNGYAISKGEYIEALFNVAAPVRNFSGEVIASFSITDLVSYYTTVKKQNFIKLSIEAARHISEDLGYFPQNG